ncbi:MAG: MopE-related protein, partial [Nitrosomonas sp.]
MKTKITLLRSLFMVLCCTLFSLAGKAQNGVQFSLSNDVQTSPTELEFDVYIISTFPGTFELAGHQYNIAYNNAMKNGGTMTAAWLVGSTQLSNTAQLQNTINAATAGQLRLAGPPAPGAGAGSIIATAPGTKVGRMKLTNSIPWASVTPNLVFNLVTINPRTSANWYNGTANTPFCVPGISIPTCLNLTTTTYTNALLANAQLNPPLCTAPTLSASTVAASCAGDSNGSIDLTTTGGNPTPFDFLWSNGAITEDISGLVAGTYTVTVSTTVGGCVATASYTVADGAPNVTYYADADNDTYGDALVSIVSCTGAPTGYVVDATDCNDNNAAINPGAAEVCNGIDDDCDGLTDEGLIFLDYYVDVDGDGFGNPNVTPINSCNPVVGSVANSGDCDDNNNAINPNATEVCDLVDNDCDGLIDEGVQSTFFVDFDGDSYGSSAGAILACSPPLGYVTNSLDCDDNNAAVNPAALEVCNGIDDDCNGLADDGLVFLTYYVDADNDGYGDASATGVSSCNPIAGSVTNNGDCNDNNLAINPAAIEVCDLVDNDCDGLIDEGVQSTFYADVDGDGFGNAASSVLACSAPLGYVTNSTDCDDNNAAINPAALEVCNGIDDNCDGLADDGLTFVTYYADADGDTYGNALVSQSTCNGAPVGYVVDATDCNDANAAVNPGATEVCNGIDDDCDGLTDEGLTFLTYYVDADGDGYGDASA